MGHNSSNIHETLSKFLHKIYEILNDPFTAILRNQHPPHHQLPSIYPANNQWEKAERDSITKQHNCNTPKSNRVGQSFSIKNIIQLNEHKKQTNQFKNEIIYLTIIVFCNERIFLRGMGERTLRLKGFLVGNSFERIGGY